MTIIEQIKAEIERRKGQAKEHYNEPYSIGRCDAFAEMLNFINSLEEKSEKPIEGLEEEINRLWESFADEMEGPHNLFDIYARLARHFAQWGAEHLIK